MKHSLQLSDIQLAEHLVAQCESHSINLCETEDQWFKIALSLANLGEAGRQLFHRLSRLSHKYHTGENDRKFSHALTLLCRASARRISLGTFIALARQAGATLKGCKPEHSAPSSVFVAAPKPLPAYYMPIEPINDAMGMNNNLCRYLRSLLPAAAIERAVHRYKIGSGARGETIFPQVDLMGWVRTAKVISYDPSTGHRHRHQGASWLHTRSDNPLRLNSSTHRLSQCLFGEHLLANAPADALIGLVEAEKTALVASICAPQVIWIAVGGKSNFSERLLRPLQGRRVKVYADADAAADWQRRAEQIPFAKDWIFAQWHINEAPDSHRDIADLMLQKAQLHPGIVPDLSDLELLEHWQTIYPEFQKFCQQFELRLS